MTSLDLCYRPVVLFAGVERAFDSRTIDELNFLRHSRIYGLRVAGKSIGPRLELLLEGLIGPVLGTVGRARRARTVSVHVADWPCQALSCGPFGLDWKRDGIWHNPDRNAAIASIARSIADGDETHLWVHGLFLDEALNQRGPRYHRRVAIIVESPEHGRTLAALLPGWRLLCDPESRAGHRESAGEERRSRKLSETASLDKSIITMARASHLHSINTDVLIRGDGMPWTMELPLSAGVRNEEDLTLIDLHDEFDAIASASTKDRLRHVSRPRLEAKERRSLTLTSRW